MNVLSNPVVAIPVGIAIIAIIVGMAARSAASFTAEFSLCDEASVRMKRSIARVAIVVAAIAAVIAVVAFLTMIFIVNTPASNVTVAVAMIVFVVTVALATVGVAWYFGAGRDNHSLVDPRSTHN